MGAGRAIAALACLVLAACATPQSPNLAWHVVPGSLEPNRGPDGNSVLLDAPDGLILVDTGRHPEHRDALLAYARSRGRPVAAIVNTHWHLDHSTGNAELRAQFPEAPLYASNAIDGALRGFLATSRAQAQARLDSGQVPEARRAEVLRFLSVMADPDSLRPSRPVTASGAQVIAGRRLRVNLARFAATEGDVWIHDPEAGLVIAGDLVVAAVPFFDTACPQGWRRALDEIAATEFTSLIPGHGDAMTRGQFLQWRVAFDNLLDCAASTAERQACVAGWNRDAAPFLSPHRTMSDELLAYYVDQRLRAPPEERDRYCRPQA